MKQLLLLLIGACLLGTASSGKETASDLRPFFGDYDGALVLLDVKRNTFTRYNPRRCKQRFSPCSTFKIPNSLIALETGAIPSPDHLLKWDGTKHPIEPHNRDHTMRTAFSESAVWYYQRAAERIGPQRMERYVRALDYGNEEVSGGEPFWINGNLRISAEEQVAFLRRLYRGDLPLSARAMESVKELMVAAKTERGVLRGKTGTGGESRNGVLTATLGWYVGWVEQGASAYIFATNISGGENPSGRTARGITEAILKSRGLL